MNRRIIGSTALMAGFLILAGCRSAWKTTSDEETVGPMHEKAAKITANGGLAAVGTGRAKTIAAAVERSKTLAQRELAHIADTTVETLKNDFSEEVGEKSSKECDAFFGLAVRQLRSAVLPEVPLTATEYGTRDGLTTAYALMELDPKILVLAMEDAGQANKSFHARFSASKTFKKLDERVKKYKDFKTQ